jgi:hypothetical protein
MRKKTAWIIILSVLLFLCLTALGYWYVTVYRCNIIPISYEFLESFDIKNNCKEKVYEVKGIIYNINLAENYTTFDFNAWDIENKNSLYWDKISLPLDKYKGDIGIFSQEILPVEIELSFVSNKEWVKEILQKQSFQLNTWDIQNLEINKEELETKLEQTYDPLLFVRNGNSTTASNDGIQSTWLLSTYLAKKKSYINKEVIFTQKPADITIDEEISTEIEKLEPLNCILHRDIAINNGKTEQDIKKSLTWLGCDLNTLERLAETKISSRAVEDLNEDDLSDFINIENLLNNTSQENKSTKAELLKKLDVLTNIWGLYGKESIEPKIDQALFLSIIHDTIIMQLLDYELFCKLSYALDEDTHHSYYNNSELLFRGSNLREILKFADSDIKSSMYCTSSFLNANATILNEWAETNIVKTYYLHYRDNPVKYIKEQTNFSSFFINILLNNYE